MLLIGIVIGALASAFYTGMRSGDPDRLGSGLKQLLEVPHVDVETPTLTLPVDRAPARAAFDFFTVLPDERVIPETAATQIHRAAMEAQITNPGSEPIRFELAIGPASDIAIRRASVKPVLHRGNQVLRIDLAPGATRRLRWQMRRPDAVQYE